MSEQSAHPNVITQNIIAALIAQSFYNEGSNEKNAEKVAAMYKTIYKAVLNPDA